MAQLLLIDDDPGTLEGFELILRNAGHSVSTAASGTLGLDLIDRESFDLVLADLRLPDISGLLVLQRLRQRNSDVPFIIVSGYARARDAVEAMRLGAMNVLEKPVFEDELLQTVRLALRDSQGAGAMDPPAQLEPPLAEAHAASRWARIVAPVVDAPKDPRTITGWSRLVFASPGALRNWCRTAGVTPRRSLVFARLLRAVALSHGGRHRTEDLIDVVDRRTLVGLLKFAGLNPGDDFPTSIDEFLQRQTLVCEPDRLLALKRALLARRALSETSRA